MFMFLLIEIFFWKSVIGSFTSRGVFGKGGGCCGLSDWGSFLDSLASRTAVVLNFCSLLCILCNTRRTVFGIFVVAFSCCLVCS